MDVDYFMESLVSNLSPNASPLQSLSPRKGRKSPRNPSVLQPGNPDLVDEGSVDIYGDILKEPQSTDGDITQLGNNELAPEGAAASASSSKMNNDSIQGTDSISELASPDKCELEKLKARINELTLTNKKLKLENDNLVVTKTQLSKNISCLFLTCRNELQSKDKEIEQLRNTIKTLQTTSKEDHLSYKMDTITRNKRGSSPKQYNRTQSQSSSQSPDEISCSRIYNDRKESPLGSRKHSVGRSRRDCDQDVRNSKTSSGRKISHLQSRHGRRSKSGSKESKSERDRGAGEESSPIIHRNHRSKEGSRKERDSHSSQQQHSQHKSASKVSTDDSSNKKLLPKSNDKSHELRCSNKFVSEEKVSKDVNSLTKSIESRQNDTHRNFEEYKEVNVMDTKGSNWPVCKFDNNKVSQCESITKTVMEHGTRLIDCNEGRKNQVEDRMNIESLGKLSSEQLESCKRKEGEIEGSERRSEGVTERRSKSGSERTRERCSERRCDGVSEKCSEGVDERTREDFKERCSERSHEGVSERSRKDIGERCSERNYEGVSEKCSEGVDERTRERCSERSCEGESEKCSEGDSKRSNEEVDREISGDVSKNKKDNIQVNEKLTFMSKGVSVMHLSQTVPLESTGAPNTILPAQIVSKKDTAQNKVEQTIEKSLPQSCDRLKQGDNLSNKFSNRPASQNDSEGIASTSCVVSNQEWDSVMSPGASLPFSKMKSPDPVSPKHNPSHVINTSSPILTNQTWPFENRDATTTCGESSISQIEKPVMSKCDKESAISSEPVRAFPISDLKDGSNSSSSQLINESLFTKDESESVSDEKLESNPVESKNSVSKSKESTSEEATNSSSGPGGEASSKESTTSNTSDTSNELKKSSSLSTSSSLSSSKSSSNLTVIPKIGFQSPSKPGFVWNPNSLHYEDCTNLTPPKPKHMRQSTPVKQPSTNYDSNTLTPSKSDNILCTPNLIVLGDEETTSATIISPFKSNSVPSEFIPPGVRKEIKESNTHFRHIRGKPEFLHRSPANSESPDVHSEVKDGLLPSDLGFQKTHPKDKKVRKSKVDIEKEGFSVKEIGNISVGGVLASKSGNSNDDEEIGETVDNCNGSVNGTQEDLDAGEGRVNEFMDETSKIQPIARMAFQKVFRKNISDFKKEMTLKSCSKSNQRVLASRLRHSARLVQSSSTLAPVGVTCTPVAPTVSSDQNSGMMTDQLKQQQTAREIIESNNTGLALKCSKLPKVDDGLKQQKDFVNEWVWHTSFNIKTPKRVKSASKVTKSHSQPNVQSNTRMQETEEVTTHNELSFRGKILSIKSKKADEDQILPQLQKGPEKSGMNVPISPTNSCRVTSSSVEYTEQEAHSERSSSAQKKVSNDIDDEVMNSPEPDSTSDPIIFKAAEGRGLHCSKIEVNKQNFTSNKASTDPVLNRLNESHSPDSPTKCLGPVRTISKSPKKRALDFRSCNSPNRNKSSTSCSSSEKQEVSQVESDLFLSSSDGPEDNSDTDDEGENTLNATYIINAVQSESECENVHNEPSNERNPSSGCNKIGGKTPIGHWDEVSLMESHSLSEFDRDVVMPQQHPPINKTRMSSRTDSFSSHISVGGFSPFSFTSPKLTPSHIRSPKDALWSPLNRTNESRDMCHDDVRTPASCGLSDVEESDNFDKVGSDPNPSSSPNDVDGAQLVKLFSLQTLQQMELVKTRWGLESSDSCSSSDDGSSGSGTESDDEDCVTPVKSGSKVVSSPAKSPLKVAKKEEPVKLLRSPRVSKLCRESFNSIASCSQQSISLRRSPRKNSQELRSPKKSVEKLVKNHRGGVSTIVNNNYPRQSPQSKETIQIDNSKKISERKNVTNSGRDEMMRNPERDHYSKRDNLSKGLYYSYDSPQKSVRIVDESSSGENIVIGSCSQESNVLLKRLCGSNSESAGKCSKSPIVKNSRGNSSFKASGLSETLREDNVNISKSVDKIDGESEDGSGASASSLDKRPLSLQENNDVDHVLISRQAEFVHSVIKVTRRLDLGKTKTEKQDVLKLNEKCDNNDDREDQVVGENNCFVFDTAVVDNCSNDNDDSDGVEDGEILDDDDEVEETLCQDKGSSQQFKCLGEQGSKQNKGSENERFHITQDGCKVIASPKLVPRKRGKNFACRKDSTSGHGVSPMERVYTPPSSSSGSDAKKERAKVREANSNKRNRSRSPNNPDRKRPKMEKKDRQSNSNIRDCTTEKDSRSYSPHGSDRRRSPGYSGRRNRSPLSSHSRRHRSPRSDRRIRSPARNQRQNSSGETTSRHVSPRKGVKLERKHSTHRSPNRRESGEHSRSVERGSRRESGRSREIRNTHSTDKSCDRSSNSKCCHTSKEDEKCQDRRKRHTGNRCTERSRSRSKDSSCSRHHHENSRSQCKDSSRRHHHENSRSQSKDSASSHCHCHDH